MRNKRLVRRCERAARSLRPGSSGFFALLRQAADDVGGAVPSQDFVGLRLEAAFELRDLAGAAGFGRERGPAGPGPPPRAARGVALQLGFFSARPRSTAGEAP